MLWIRREVAGLIVNFQHLADGRLTRAAARADAGHGFVEDSAKTFAAPGDGVLDPCLAYAIAQADHACGLILFCRSSHEPYLIFAGACARLRL